MPTTFHPVPNWGSWENQGAGIALADVDGDGQLELVVLQVDNPGQANRGLYRVGRGLDAQENVTGGWGPWLEVPDWGSWENQGAGIALADVDGDGQLELVVLQVDNPGQANRGLYRVGRGLDAQGNVTGGWGPWLEVPDWGSWENQGAGIALADVDGDGQLELVAFQVDAPAGLNRGLYRVGRALDADARATGGWGPWIGVDWFSWENQGAGIALADVDGDGRPELVVFQVDNPAQVNGAYYQIGWDLDADGEAAGGWSPWVAVPDWFSWENQGADVALVAPTGGGRPRLAFLAVDGLEQANAGVYGLVDLQLDLDDAATRGVWRLLSGDSKVLAIHAALLRTGKVLFFAGSSNNPDRADGDFRSIVWDPVQRTFFAPPTPIDFFCAGHAFLPDGRLLVAGGTKEYDFGHPFFGLRDAFTFDPDTESWTRVDDMGGGRWYPTLVALGDGRVLAMSGLGEHGESPNPDLEIYDEPGGWTTLPQALSDAWPLYPHLVLLDDGRLLYSGAYFGVNYEHMKPRLVDLGAATFVDVQGMTLLDARNQGATALLAPAQDQRVMVLGGGAGEADGHHTHEATNSVRIVDLHAANPVFEPAAALLEPRMHLNAVLLPDRSLLVCGGSREHESREKAALEAELYDPPTGAWTLGATSRVPRLYHSVAVLLPDGTVITAGSNPARLDEELRLELYLPPYLFRGPRPQLDAAPTELAYGQTFAIATSPAQSVAQVSLVRPKATTHASDTDQRLVAVDFQAAGTNSLDATAPASPELAPPGWYMLFLATADGVPSVARWVHLT